MQHREISSFIQIRFNTNMYFFSIILLLNVSGLTAMEMVQNMIVLVQNEEKLADVEFLNADRFRG